MMKLDESKALVILSSVILGFLLASQVNFGNIIPKEILTFQDYQQVSSEIRKVTDELNILDEKKSEMESNLISYQNSDQSDSQKVQKLQEELNKQDFYAGLTDVVGPGIVISLNDNPIKGDFNAPLEILLSPYVHDLDIRALVWELKNDGAEIISVNDQRIISNTEFYCEGPIIRINNVKLAPPYIIKVIGDPDKLSFILTKEESQYKDMESRGILTDYWRENYIKILKYSGSYGYFYMKPAKDE